MLQFVLPDLAGDCISVGGLRRAQEGLLRRTALLSLLLWCYVLICCVAHPLREKTTQMVSHAST